MEPASWTRSASWRQATALDRRAGVAPVPAGAKSVAAAIPGVKPASRAGDFHGIAELFQLRTYRLANLALELYHVAAYGAAAARQLLERGR